MAMRSIVCVFDGKNEELSALEAAIALAKREAGHLRIVHVSLATSVYIAPLGDAALMTGAWREAVDREAEEAEAVARSAARECCAQHQLVLDSVAPERPRATFKVVDGASSAALMAELSTADLIVFGSGGGADFVERSVPRLALFSTARPILLVRAGSKVGDLLADSGFAIAWNASSESVHALLNARPMIERGSGAHLFLARDARQPGEMPEATLPVAYLADHGVRATVETVDADGERAAETVLRRARELGCGTIVMGAYGHSVFREVVLGGFSRHMLQHSEIPLLMTH